MREPSPPATEAMRRPLGQILAAILWPSFLVAGAANSLFFVAVHPHELAATAGLPESIGSTGIYSLGFFCCWLFTALSSAGTQYFLRPLRRAPSSDPRT